MAAEAEDAPRANDQAVDGLVIRLHQLRGYIAHFLAVTAQHRRSADL
jgi:hypothetical protein